jgi:hypothetical protein
VKNEIKSQIAALKEKNIPVVESSIQIQTSFVSQDPSQDPAYIKLKGSFSSESKTAFSLAIDFFPRDGFLNTPKDIVGFYSRLQYDQLDAEGNPVNGHCMLETDAKLLVKNIKAGATVAELVFPAFQVN